jgi:hypothetical protein
MQVADPTQRSNALAQLAAEDDECVLEALLQVHYLHWTSVHVRGTSMRQAVRDLTFDTCDT